VSYGELQTGGSRKKRSAACHDEQVKVVDLILCAISQIIVI
jgi:hypothetical protein